jgi:hypothetical protein
MRSAEANVLYRQCSGSRLLGGASTPARSIVDTAICSKPLRGVALWGLHVRRDVEAA